MIWQICAILLYTPFQGEVHIYGSHAELAERKIDTVQILGLIQEGKGEHDEFAIDKDSYDKGTIHTTHIHYTI